MAVAGVSNGSSQSSVASEIIILDLRTGARAVWRGGMDRPGQTFGIEDLSWTGDGKSVAYLGAWCPPGESVTASTAASSARPWPRVRPKPIQAQGGDVVREIRLAPGGGALTAGRVLRAPAPASGPLPVLVDPDGRS